MIYLGSAERIGTSFIVFRKICTESVYGVYLRGDCSLKERRLGRWDNAKWFLICCVVFGHVANPFRSGNPVTAAVQFWVYLFHMPAFIFIAGMFSKRTVNERRWPRAFSYVLLYLLMKVLKFLADLYVEGSSKAELDLLKVITAPWFALAMCWFLLITMLIRNFRMRYVLSVSVILAVAFGYTRFPGTFLSVTRTIVFYPFFYLGYKADLERTERFLGKRPVRILGQVILLGSLAYVLADFDRVKRFRKLFRARYTYRQISKSLWMMGGGLRIGAYVVSAVLVFAVLASMPRKRGSFARLGERTMSVFALHYSLMTLLIYGVPGCEAWVGGGLTFLKCIFLSIVILAVTSLPVFERMIRALMDLPERAVYWFRKKT